ncbi:MAG: hypothetical protein U1G08_19690 [Verrucomicrobiota bacterium]
MNTATVSIACALLFGAGTAALGATTVYSFENGSTQGWRVNDASWASGFSSIAVADEHATDGTRSLRIDFVGQSYKWGAVVENQSDPVLLEALSRGGKLILDLYVPESSAGISQLGFVIQQPDVSGDKNWQQVWYWIGGATGSFTVELPFERLGSGPVNLHLGQNATENQSFSVYVDQIRVESNPPSGPEPIVLETFEDGTTQGWVVNAEEWGKGFTSLENSTANASQGTHSLKISMQGQSYKWGAYNRDLSDPALLQAIQYGGKFQLDLFIPEDSDGIQNLGFSFQQAGVDGALGWQQVWFAVNGATGRFTVELPFQRSGNGPVTFNLGQNANAEKSYTVYLDHLRVIPNAPPPAGVTVTRTHRILSFEDGTSEGFSINDQGWGLAFTTVDSAEGNATDGTRSLKTTFPAGDFKWGAYANGLSRADLLSALSENGTLLVDVFIPGDSSTIQHLGVSISQPGATGGKDWQQTWFYIGGKSGRFTIDVPFTRENDGVVNLNLGRNSTGEGDAEVYWDNFRVVTTELVGAEPGSVQVTALEGGKARVDFRGNLTSSSALVGPFSPENGSTPLTVDPAVAGSVRYYRAEGKPIVYFQDDFEGATSGWKTSGTGPAWERGTPGYPDEITEAHSGSSVWATSLSTPYGTDLSQVLTSPVIDLSSATTAARLSFYDMLDVGGDGDADQAEIYVRSETGAVLAGAESAIWKGSRASSGPYFFQRKVVSLPAVASGKKVRLEFRLQSDANGDGVRKGWMLDDVSVYAQP